MHLLPKTWPHPIFTGSCEGRQSLEARSSSWHIEHSRSSISKSSSLRGSNFVIRYFATSKISMSVMAYASPSAMTNSFSFVFDRYFRPWSLLAWFLTVLDLSVNFVKLKWSWLRKGVFFSECFDWMESEKLNSIVVLIEKKSCCSGCFDWLESERLGSIFYAR